MIGVYLGYACWILLEKGPGKGRRFWTKPPRIQSEVSIWFLQIPTPEAAKVIKVWGAVGKWQRSTPEKDMTMENPPFEDV